ncbi:DUF2156 domain-containing protein [Candidatus Omnitrophota bacterium]
MKPIELPDKSLFDTFLKQERHSLSAYSFVSIYLWKDVFDIFWEIIDGRLCVFAQDSVGCFMWLPPLGESPDVEVIERCFHSMNTRTRNGSVARIENIEEEQREHYAAIGLPCSLKDKEYVYQTERLIGLKGNTYKKKRSAYNYFTKHYDCTLRPFADSHREECLALYDRWVNSRKQAYSDPVYIQMLQDNYRTTQRALEDYRELELEGKVAVIDDEVKGYSFGFSLHEDTFCIIFEVADVMVKGLSQYLFREFVKEKQTFSYINAMDASYLENLQKVKESYRPFRLEPSYIATKAS